MIHYENFHFYSWVHCLFNVSITTRWCTEFQWLSCLQSGLWFVTLIFLRFLFQAVITVWSNEKCDDLDNMFCFQKTMGNPSFLVTPVEGVVYSIRCLPLSGTEELTDHMASTIWFSFLSNELHTLPPTHPHADYIADTHLIMFFIILNIWWNKFFLSLLKLCRLSPLLQPLNQVSNKSYMAIA